MMYYINKKIAAITELLANKNGKRFKYLKNCAFNTFFFLFASAGQLNTYFCLHLSTYLFASLEI